MGSNPTPGSILLFLSVLFLLLEPSGVRGEVGGSYQRLYQGAAYISLEPEVVVPSSLSLNVKSGFAFSRKLVMELILGLGNVPYPSSGTYYFGTRMYYKIVVDHYRMPGFLLMIGANNRSRLGIDLGIEISKRMGNISPYFVVLDKALVTRTGEFNSDFLLIPGVEIGISSVYFVTFEAGWSVNSSVSFISSSLTFAIY